MRRLIPRVSETVVECAADPICEEELRDETWLLRLAASNFRRFASLASDSIYPTRKVLTWGSLCSGSEGAAFVMRAIGAALKEAKQPVQLSHRFSCEINKEKRDWISCVTACEERVMQKLERKATEQRKAAEARGAGDGLGPKEEEQETEEEGWEPGDSKRAGGDRSDSDLEQASLSGQATDVADLPCLFTDILDMGDNMAACSCHSTATRASKCFIPTVDLLLVGTSCKDMSKANPNKKRDREQATLSLQHSRGGSAQTYRGLVKYLAKRKPPLVVFEKVDNLDESSQGGMSNQQILMDELAQLGYEGQPTICEASKFGCSCRRRRCYIFFIQAAANPVLDLMARSLQTCFKDFRAFLSSCMREGPSLEKLLLPPDDPAVLAELRARQEKNKVAEPMSTVSKAEWPEQHMQFAQNMRVLWTQRAGKHLQMNDWFHTLGLREKNALPLLQQQVPARTAMIRDLSQSIGRANSVTWQEDARRHICPTLLSRQALWAETDSQARLLLGREALRMQGFPIFAFLEELASSRTQSGNKCATDTDGTQSGSSKKTRAGTLSGEEEAQLHLGPGFPSEALMWDLAGNGMSLPVLMAVIQSGLSCLAWRSGDVAAPLADQDAVRVACQAVDLLSHHVEVEPLVPPAPSALLKKRRAS